MDTQSFPCIVGDKIFEKKSDKNPDDNCKYLGRIIRYVNGVVIMHNLRCLFFVFAGKVLYWLFFCIEHDNIPYYGLFML